LQKERGFYVEGYAMSHEDWPFQHAWITLDGLHAVDVTLRSPASDCFYFGISIPFRILRAEILARDGRFPVPLLDHAFPMAKMEGVLQRAIAVPPDCALTWSLS